jgi:hypothetical protein
LDQFLAIAFAQLTYRESLRDIEACLSSQAAKLYHMGFRCQRIRRSTLAYANNTRDWRIYRDFAQVLIAQAQTLYRDEPFAVDLANTIYAFDSTTIDLCLSLFPWAAFRKAKAGVKLHVLLNLRTNIPAFMALSVAKMHDLRMFDTLIFEPGAIYVFDRAYTDFKRLHRLHQASAFFVIRAKDNLHYNRLESRPVDKSTGVRSDQVIRLAGFYSSKEYSDKLRRITYHDQEKNRSFVFLTNNFLLPALTIAQIHKCRWQIELFFKWIKQHLRIKAFYGTSENAVRTQIWIAVATYVLVAIVKKQLNVDRSLYNILQILSTSVFVKVPLNQLLMEPNHTILPPDPTNLFSGL